MATAVIVLPAAAPRALAGNLIAVAAEGVVRGDFRVTARATASLLTM